MKIRKRAIKRRQAVVGLISIWSLKNNDCFTLPAITQNGTKLAPKLIMYFLYSKIKFLMILITYKSRDCLVKDARFLTIITQQACVIETT